LPPRNLVTFLSVLLFAYGDYAVVGIDPVNIEIKSFQLPRANGIGGKKWTISWLNESNSKYESKRISGIFHPKDS